MNQKFWIARDKDGQLCGYCSIPDKKTHMFYHESNCCIFDNNLYPEITFDNSPKEFILVSNNLNVGNFTNDDAILKFNELRQLISDHSSPIHLAMNLAIDALSNNKETMEATK